VFVGARFSIFRLIVPEKIAKELSTGRHRAFSGALPLTISTGRPYGSRWHSPYETANIVIQERGRRGILGRTEADGDTECLHSASDP
jgi:hypothetical protein